MKNKRSWFLAFFVPFLIVGALTVWHWYDYGLQDMRNARAKIWGTELFQVGDEAESLKFALLIGSVCAIPAGLSGLAIYFVIRKLQRKS